MTRPTPIGLARLLLTLAAVAAVVYLVDWSQFVGIMAGAQLSLLLLAYGLFLADRFLMSFKWSLLLEVQRVRVPLWENWAVYSTASLWSVFLPSSVGADALRVIWLWRRGYGGTAGTASVVVERLVGFAASLLLAGVALLYLIGRTGRAGLRESLLVVGATLLLLVLLLGVSFSERLAGAIAGAWRRRATASRLAARLERLGAAYAAYRSARGTVLAFFLLTCFEQVFMLGMGYAVARSVGVPASALDFGAAFALALLVTRLPISIDGIGVFEGVMVLLLSLLGVAPAHAVAFAVLGRIMNVVALAPGAIVSAVFSDFRPRDMTADEKGQPSRGTVIRNVTDNPV